METSAYLSIDIDFWLMIPEVSHIRSGIRYLEQLYTHARENGIHCRVKTHHHQLLSHVDGCEFDKLINIDYHSDVGELTNGMRDFPLTEGTWVNYVFLREQADFLWVYPQQECFERSGRCECYVGDFVGDRFGWKSATARRRLPSISRTYIKRVGVCVSPGWRYESHYETPDLKLAAQAMMKVVHKFASLDRPESKHDRPKLMPRLQLPVKEQLSEVSPAFGTYLDCDNPVREKARPSLFLVPAAADKRRRKEAALRSQESI